MKIFASTLFAIALLPWQAGAQTPAPDQQKPQDKPAAPQAPYKPEFGGVISSS